MDKIERVKEELMEIGYTKQEAERLIRNYQKDLKKQKRMKILRKLKAKEHK